MDREGRFISDGSDGNISRFVDQLRRGTNPAREKALKCLLIEEENRFGAREEHLEMVERNLADGSALIARQTRLVAEMKWNGSETVQAERTLRTFEMIQSLFERYRALIYEALERATP